MRLVIKEDRPGRRVAAICLSLLVLAFFAGSAWNNGHIQRVIEFASAEPTAPSEIELDELRNRVAVLERTDHINQKAYTEVQETVKELQRHNLALKGELAFYREILASTRGEEGVNVQGFTVRRLGTPQRFSFELVLINLAAQDEETTGTVSLVFEGLVHGAPKRMSLSEVAERNSPVPPFNIKRFARVEGVFSLPEGFSPERVRVALKTKFNGLVEKIYDWAIVVV